MASQSTDDTYKLTEVNGERLKGRVYAQSKTEMFWKSIC